MAKGSDLCLGKVILNLSVIVLQVMILLRYCLSWWDMNTYLQSWCWHKATVKKSKLKLKMQMGSAFQGNGRSGYVPDCKRHSELATGGEDLVRRIILSDSEGHFNFWLSSVIGILKQYFFLKKTEFKNMIIYFLTKLLFFFFLFGGQHCRWTWKKFVQCFLVDWYEHLTSATKNNPWY